MVSTALYRSGVLVPNGEMAAQLSAGAEQFTVPFWADLPDVEADITSDNPSSLSTPQKVTASSMQVRKAFLHQSWSEMSLASELSGSDALQRIQSRVQAYWDRQWEKRLIASMMGVLYSNINNNAGDMMVDITVADAPGFLAATGTATISGGAVTGITLGVGGGPYPITPLVTLTGGGGSGATAIANLTNGAVSSFTVKNGGTGYTGAPTVTITPEPGTANKLNNLAVISTALTLGDRLSDLKAIAMHSTVYGYCVEADEIQFFKPSQNGLEIPTYKGLYCIVDDSLTTATPGVYVTILFGPGAVGYAVAPPRTGYGTELWRTPNAGNGGGQTTLHTRFDVAIHPLGFNWTNSSVAGVSPTQAELALAANWTRGYSQRKSIPLAFLISN